MALTKYKHSAICFVNLNVYFISQSDQSVFKRVIRFMKKGIWFNDYWHQVNYWLNETMLRSTGKPEFKSGLSFEI